MPWLIACVVLFWPLAIPGIINASRVNALVAAGDHRGAKAASDKAGIWATWATVLGVISWGGAIALIAALVVAPAQVASLISILVGHT
jgi:hypothetical protein